MTGVFSQQLENPGFKVPMLFGLLESRIALTNFESVLVIDRAADKSRALAMACAIEIGNMVKAQQLNTDYELKGERWEQWANGKMMLATNAIQQGTEKFASLAKKYPTFPTRAWIEKGNHVLRQIDWALYSKLMQAPSNAVPSNMDGAK